MKILTEEIGSLLKDIQDRRGQIKEEYIKAWLAVTLPENAPLDWIIKNCHIEEKWSQDRLTVTWRMVQNEHPRD